MGYWLEERRKDDERHAERNRKADDYDRLADEVERLRLTDAEREAIEKACDLADHAGFHSTTRATLRGLLDRHRAMHNRFGDA